MLFEEILSCQLNKNSSQFLTKWKIYIYESLIKEKFFQSNFCLKPKKKEKRKFEILLTCQKPRKFSVQNGKKSILKDYLMSDKHIECELNSNTCMKPATIGNMLGQKQEMTLDIVEMILEQLFHCCVRFLLYIQSRVNLS